MVTRYTLENDAIELNIEGPYQEDFIAPTMRFQFTFFNRSQQRYHLTGMTYRFNIINNKGQQYGLCYLTFDEGMLDLLINSDKNINGYVTMDHYILKKIEEIRSGGDVRYRIYGGFVGIPMPSPPQITSFKRSDKNQVESRISKSDWVEKFLPAFQFKNVSLLEIPSIDSEDFRKVSEHLDSAWKQKFMGEYDKVLTDCRKVIEEIGTIVRKKGFEIEEDGTKRPDWKKFFSGDNDIGDIFGTINQKIYGFTWPGAHTGKSINLEDADYALMITHSIANMVIKKFKKE